MAFTSIPKIEKYEVYIDYAFKAAQKRAGEIRTDAKGSRFEKSKKIELERITEVKKVLHKHLNTLLKSFPSLDSLTEFYKEMIRNLLDYPELKRSLGAVKWATEKIDFFFRQYSQKIKSTEEQAKINALRREYYGRINSVLKQIKGPLNCLENARKTIKTFPSIKEEFTVCIVGFPNVGKTTLLHKLTGSKPEINSYAFTTKELNIGYKRIGLRRVQFIDTPGTLNRFDAMNIIEKQAHLAVKYCADMLVYVFDLTEPFPLKDQMQLYDDLKKSNKTKQIIVYFSKSDIVEKEKIKDYADKNKIKDFFIDIEELKEEMEESM